MVKEKVSNQTKWTEHEKLKVMLSIFEASNIDWKKVYIPEGRSMKAVKCMLDGAKKAVKNGDLDGAATGKAAPKPKAVAVGPKRKRTEEQLEAAVDEDDKEEDVALVKKQKTDSEEKLDVEDQGESEVKTQEDSAEMEVELGDGSR